MTKYLIDTNHIIALFRGKHNIDKMFIEKGVHSMAISEITLAELYYGAYRSGNYEKEMQRINNLVLAHFVILPVSESLQLYAQIKHSLEKKGTPLHDDFDLLIAATTISNNLTLVTDNTKDFKNITGLKMENWVQRS